MTSGNIGDAAPQAATPASLAVEAGNPNVQHCDLGGHGFTVVDVRRDEVRAEWWQVPTARERVGGERLSAAGTVARGSQHLVMTSG